MTAYGALTDYPVGVQRKIPFRIHKIIDEGNLAAMFLVPLVTGVLKQRRVGYLFLELLAVGLKSVLLTDWKEEKRSSNGTNH